MTREELRIGRLVRWWHDHAVAKVDHVEVIRRIEEDAVWSPRYLFMTLMSAGIALLGLLLSSPAVVIGAMLISPLMGPIIGLGFALAVFDSHELQRSATALGLGTVIAIAFTALIVLLSPLQTVTPEIAARTRPNLFDLLVALFSALAGSYAMIRGRSGTIVGVAIATALMPPLAVVGFSLATANATVFGGALLLFVTNLVTIALTATVMARIYGFGGRLSPAQTRTQGIVLFATFLLLAVPLGLSLRQIAWEAFAARQAREAVKAQFPEKANLSEFDLDYATEPMQVRAVMFTPELASDANARAERLLRETLGQPFAVSISQVRTSNTARAAEAAQLAAAQDRAKAQLAADQSIRESIALIAGIEPEAVMLDSQTHRATAFMRPLPGATIESYRMLEKRIADGSKGWTIALVPPLAALPSLPQAEDARAQAIDTAIWAAQRTGAALGVGGPTKDAEALLAVLAEKGVAARRIGGRALRIEWTLPTPAG